MADLENYKLEKKLEWQNKAKATEKFPETAFCDSFCDLLAEGGHLDDPIVLEDAHRDTNRGTRLDAYAWNENEGIITAIVIDFDEEDEVITISKTDVEKAGNRATKFLEQIENSTLDHLEESSEGYQAASSLKMYMNEPNVVKFRVAVLTSKVLSSRAKKDFSKKDQKFKLNRKIIDKECFLEIYDLKRFRDIEMSGEESEPVDVNLIEMGGALKALPANIGEPEVDSYLCVMPGKILSNLYEEYGQRLLESNVRTFLQFGGGVNKGIRTTLLSDPDNFFAYNNGLTVTAKNIKTCKTDSGLEITDIEDMQIVNGGQTSSAIYFAPKDKSKIASGQEWKDIDLSRVFVQMKLSVIKNEDNSNDMKANIAKYANSQNAVNTADLQSNHPFHRKLEEISRRMIMPAGDNVTASFWFYERARGQYQTLRRKLRTPSKIKEFEYKFPRSQLFNKTDLAKYENTWRMNPNEVKQGAAKNFLAVSKVLSSEFEKDPDSFTDHFYKELIAKAILFRESDREIGRTSWYLEERGLKAETTTYTLALLRYLLRKQDKDINLKKIFDQQKLSGSLLTQIIDLAKIIRDKMNDEAFRGGMSNVSEFCKKLTTWEKYQSLDYKLELIERSDWLNKTEQLEALEEKRETEGASNQLNIFEEIQSIKPNEWWKLAEWNQEKGYEYNSIQVSLPRLTGDFLKGSSKKILSEKQMSSVVKILKDAKKEGFLYIDD
tara:strand:+ start:5753 stop:7909 length:2157 start_codon:yes stop_codon:yes gene_type:complete